MKYSDEEIRTLLRKLRDKKRRYIRNEEKRNNVLLCLSIKLIFQ